MTWAWADAFDENDIRLAIFPDLTPDDLKDIGVRSVDHRRALLSAIATLCDEDSVEPAPVAHLPPDIDIRTREAERRQITVCSTIWSARPRSLPSSIRRSCATSWRSIRMPPAPSSNAMTATSRSISAMD
jgi:hypothetical protein